MNDYKWIEVMNLLLCNFRLHLTNIIHTKQNLPLKIGFTDGIVINDSNGTDSGRSKILQHRATESTGTYYQTRAAFIFPEPAIQIPEETGDGHNGEVHCEIA
jgi:hypothetical protein